ncbi:MAG: AMP-binding protein [Peptococcaceae bacterium]|nr:AMP-binding protein [Peptococcaceae bacterium]
MYPINIGYLLKLNANRYPEKTALVYNGLHVSYNELNKRVNALANSLINIGIRKGDRIAYLFHSGNQIAELYYAIQKIGAVAVPLNHRLVGVEIKYLADSAECKVFVYSDQFEEQVKEIKHEFKTVKILIRSGGSAEGEYSLQELASNSNSDEPNVEILPDDLCRIQFTGGTTGRSKGVMRTHFADFFQTVSITISGGLGGPDQVMLTQSPLCHQAGLSWMNVAIGAGNTFIICDIFNPVSILEQIQTERATAIMLLPPSIYYKIFELPNLKEYDLTSVKIVQSSAGGTSPEIICKMYETFPNCTAVRYGYGLTETGGLGTNYVISQELLQNHPERAKTVGKEMPFVELKIVDENSKEVGVGEVGECIARGPSMMNGYYNQPELTAGAIKDGWVYTGDMLKKDEDGYYYLMDRKKDMIKSGGENVFAQEVEGVIRNHPAVQDCAVIGVPDQKFGEAVMAVIKLKTAHDVTSEEIQEYCKTKLSSYKKPRYVEFVDSFPVDQAGKIQKFKLREKYKVLFN